MTDSIAKVIAEMRERGFGSGFDELVVSEWADRLAALDGWRPISTAPKDGTYVLLSGFGLPVWQGSWCGMSGRHAINGWSRFNSVDLDWRPTHWQPLPAPPEG